MRQTFIAPRNLVAILAAVAILAFNLNGASFNGAAFASSGYNGESTALTVRADATATLLWEKLNYGGTPSELMARYGFLVQQKRGEEQYATVATLTPTRNSYDFAGLTAPYTYSFRVVLRDKILGVDEPYGAEVVYSPKSEHTPPQRLEVEAVSSSGVSVIWSYPGTGYATVVERRLERSETGGSTSDAIWEKIGTARAGVNRFLDSSVTPNALYRYRARADFGSGAFSEYALATPIYGASEAPQIVALYAASPSTVYIEWSAEPSATRYVIERKTGGVSPVKVGQAAEANVGAPSTYPASSDSGDGGVGGMDIDDDALGGVDSESGSATDSSDGAYTVIATVSANRVSYTDTGVSPGERYTYRVKAQTSGNGESLYSDSQAVAVFFVGAAGQITATAVDGYLVEVEWPAVSNGAGSGASSYEIWRKTSEVDGLSGEDAELEWALIGTALGASGKYLDSEVGPGATYTYKLRARSAEGGSASGFSNEAKTSTVFLAAPDRLSASMSGSAVCELAWRDNSDGESRFVIDRKSGTTGDWSQIAYAQSNATSRGSLSVSSQALWFFRVGAVSSRYGSIAWSQPVSVDNGFGLSTAKKPGSGSINGSGSGSGSASGASAGAGSGSGYSGAGSAGSNSGSGVGSGSGAGANPGSGQQLGPGLDGVTLDRRALAAIDGAGIAKVAPGKITDGESDVTRGEFVAMLMRAIDEAGAAEGLAAVGSFRDVVASHLYYPEIMRAYAAGFADPVEGVGAAGFFFPDREATREELALFVYNSLAAVGAPLPSGAADTLEGFADSDSVSEGTATELRAVFGEKIMIGIGMGARSRAIAPSQIATREQAALVAYRYLLWLEWNMELRG